MSDSAPIKYFRGKYAFLHNGYTCNIYYDGMTFLNVESAYQAAKSWDVRHRLLCCDAPTWQDAQAFGRRVKLREDWEKVKRGIMYDLLLQKFSSYRNEKLKDMLLATGDAELIWENRHDRFWGQVNGEGENWLGRHLMNVRKRIIRESQK